MFCDVIVEIASEHVSRLFTYRVPEGMELCPGMRVLVPFRTRQIEGYVIRVKDEADGVPGIRSVVRRLEDYPAILPSQIELADWIVRTCHCLPVEAFRLMIPAQMRGGRVHEKTEPMGRLADPDGIGAALEAQGRSEKRRQILEMLRGGPRPLRELRAVSAEGVRKLIADGVITAEERETLRRPEAQPDFAQPEHTPTEDQRRVLEEVLPAVRRGEGRFLLQGVTGSGKTEVYLLAVKEALGLGKAAIVLVPEIALTPQMVGWFRSRFGDQLAVLHSRLSPGERFDEWRRIRRGSARVVVGARSAVFAPTERLGIIIVDEEHEQTYLSDQHPRYDAREVAQHRCETEGATLLLASATPSLKSFARTLPGLRSSLGPLTLLELPRRVFNRPLPEIELVDMREELVHGNRSVISGALDRALRDCLAQKHQAMLFINRRGYSTFVSCRACGKAVKCPQCDVSMTYHRGEDVLRCHYCGAEMKPPSACPACGSGSIRYFGAGTEKVEEALKQRYPGIRVLRMDVDTTRGKDAHGSILAAFRRGEADVLVGTQMIAKGLDFPEVTLVGVVAADASLNLPDYRSAERTFSLIVQVAGRAGRAEQPGRVIVQTYEPGHYCIEAASRQDYRAFFETEFERRRRGLYPPFTRMVRLLVEGDDPAAVQKRAEELGEQALRLTEGRTDLERSVIQSRVMEAPVRLIRGKSRWQVFFKLYAKGASAELIERLEALAADGGGETEVYLEVDPANMI